MATLRPPADSLAAKCCNAILFQVGWFACLLFSEELAIVITLLILVFHQWLMRPRMGEWLLVAVVGSTGLVCDSLLAVLGVLQFQSSNIGFIPVWLLCLWLLLATLLRHSLSWLQSRPLMAAMLASIAGPSSYFAGARLAGASLAEPHYLTLLVLGVYWALLMPLLFWFSRRLP